MVARRESPDGDTWLVLLNAVGTAGALDKAVSLVERSRAEGRGSEASGARPIQFEVESSRVGSVRLT